MVKERAMKRSNPIRGVKTACLGATLAVLFGAGVTMVAAQAPSADRVRLNVTGVTVPTTKILAVGSWTSKANVPGVRPLLAAEVTDTVRLYLDGVIDQWFIQQDDSGVVFLLNVTDTGKAQSFLEKLPLGQAGFMEFQLTPLGPISPLGSLIKTPAN
jgi:hypothetical protein